MKNMLNQLSLPQIFFLISKKSIQLSIYIFTSTESSFSFLIIIRIVIPFQYLPYLIHCVYIYYIYMSQIKRELEK